jgi:FkbM family methyltransferase
MNIAPENSPRFNFTAYPKAPDLEMRLRIILGRGIFERASFEMFMQHTKRRDTAIEVGAHVGSWTLGLSRLFRHVVGFEPQPENRSYLQDNLKRAKAINVTVYPKAVTSKIGQQFLISTGQDTRNSGQAHLMPRVAANQNGIPVECMRLDDLTLNASINRVDAIKIDVEGMELDVLRSGAELIRTHKPTILLEINSLCARYGFTSEQILDYMSDARYHEAGRHRYDYIFVPN